MDKFREKIIRHRRFYIAVAIISLIFMVLSILYSNSDLNYLQSKTMDGGRIGGCAGAFAGSFIYSIILTKYLNDDEKLKKLYIVDSDERTKTIIIKSSSTTFYILFFVTIISIFISSLFNPYVFFTLWVCAAVSLVTFGLSYLYFSKKY